MLIGSSGGWQTQAARDLEKSFACVCRTDEPTGPRVNPLQLASLLQELLSVAPAVMAWLDDEPCWALVELGRLIESRPNALACGVGPDPEWCWAGSVKYHVQARGFPVWNNIPETVSAARLLGQRERS